jgi:cell division protein FtsN
VNVKSTSPKKTRPVTRSGQRGGFAMGLIVGLLIGLAISLAVALYIAKIPVPFVNKVPQRTAEQDAAETAKNKDWNPNAPLAGKNPPRPQTGASGVVTMTPSGETPPPVVAIVPPPTVSAPASAAAPRAPVSTRDPAAILGERPLVSDSPPPASTRSAAADPFSYQVQAGAYGRPEDAEQQRAKLALMGLDARVTEREQAGRTVFRVRVGPYDRREDADAAKNRLDASGIEAALVRVQK